MTRGGTREKIAAAARRLLEAEGARAVSMRKVAERAGVSAMGIYHYFPSREALLRAVTAAEFETLAEAARRLPRRSVEARLLSVAGLYIDYALAQPHVFDYVFSEPRPGARRFPKDFRARRSPTLNLVADALTEGMRSGEIHRGDVWEMALHVWAHVHGYVALYRAGRIALSPSEFRALYRRSAARLVRGLRG